MTKLGLTVRFCLFFDDQNVKSTFLGQKKIIDLRRRDRFDLRHGRKRFSLSFQIGLAQRCWSSGLRQRCEFSSDDSRRRSRGVRRKTNEKYKTNLFFLRVLQNLADRPLKTRYVVATDTSKDTLIRLSRKVSQTLGTGKIKTFEQEDAMLNRDVTVTRLN